MFKKFRLRKAERRKAELQKTELLNDQIIEETKKRAKLQNLFFCRFVFHT